jgi:hypothetical protein
MPNKDVTEQTDSKIPSSSQSGRSSVSRRNLLKAGVTAMPAILTLQSGEALARSSNLIGSAPRGTRDHQGNTLCLDTRNADVVANGEAFDLGEPAYAKINAIPGRPYFYQDRWDRWHRVGPDYVCRRGREYYYYDGDWNKINLPRHGAIVSVTAVKSVSSSNLNSIVVNYLP